MMMMYSILIDVIDKSFSIDGINGTGTGSRVGRLPCFGHCVITPDCKVNAIALCDAEKYVVNYVTKVNLRLLSLIN